MKCSSSIECISSSAECLLYIIAKFSEHRMNKELFSGVFDTTEKLIEEWMNKI